MTQIAKRLIEVAIPIQEISAESVRDKSIRHGHISTLHLWWARRPLPVCRAVVFATLVPDPDDPSCKTEFRRAVQILLSKDEVHHTDPYKPYADIPWTAVYDPMPDTPRNRLQMFIGRFSDKQEDYLMGKAKKAVEPKEQLSSYSLIKWESRTNEAILNRARKLIWVSYNLEETEEHSTKTAETLLGEFDLHWKAILEAEKNLYAHKDRHLGGSVVLQLEGALEKAREAFLSRMPKVFDPFAGGGAIPLEAARLGCRSYGNDLNPVAHIIQKGSLEFPQKFGKPIVYSIEAFTKRYGTEAWKALPQEWIRFVEGKENSVTLPNRLSFDVEYYAKKLLANAEKKIGMYYPPNKNGEKPIAYYWARVATCSNPSCGAEVPLLKGFYLCNKDNKKVYLKPKIEGKSITFTIEKGVCEEEGWLKRANLSCPICGNTTKDKDLKKQFIEGTSSERILAVIEDSKEGKTYRQPNNNELEIFTKLPIEVDRPTEPMPISYTQAMPCCTWGISTWGQLFSPRQLLALQTFVEELRLLQEETIQEIDDVLRPLDSEYDKAVVTYLGILVDRVAVVNTSFGRWDITRENTQSPYSRQAIPMIFDFPESNPFCNSTGSAKNHLDWILRYIDSESEICFITYCKNASSGDVTQFKEKEITVSITDPPYYDAIAYSDLSDFFYVWLKRTLSNVYPLALSTPQTPKSEECTALKHHHENSKDKAKIHFVETLTKIFSALNFQTSGLVSIMFAHQSTEAWSTLCHSILESNRSITGSWAIDTELTNRMIGLGNAALESSVTVSCRSAERSGVGSFPEVKRSISKRVKEEVEKLYGLGFRGADLLTGCFGQAVSEFGRFLRVEKPNGDTVVVGELLDFARDTAFSALVGGGSEDPITRFVIAWLNLFGYTIANHDEVNRIVQVGLNVDIADLVSRKILTRTGNEESLTNGRERAMILPKLGEGEEDPMIDKIHKALFLFSGERKALLGYFTKQNLTAEHPFWRTLAGILEVLPDGDEKKSARSLLSSKESILSEVAERAKGKAVQQELGL
jgi:putative DNA methylase